MSSTQTHDLIVVGLGAVGSSALFHGARAGLRVLGIDRHDPPHRFGSSHAESRITRLAVGEGEQYLPFVARSHEIWRELEAETNVELLHQPGGYIITPPTPTEDGRWGGFVGRTAEIAAAAGVDFELRTAAQVNDHVPEIRLQGNESIGFEPSGGIVMCERAVEVQLRLAREAGATVITDTVVTAVEPDGAGVQVAAEGQIYRADNAIVSTGAWFSELAPPQDAAAVTVTRQAVFFFEVDDADVFSTDRFPFVIWPGHTIMDYSAVFPMAPGSRPGLKVLGEQFQQVTTAETVDRNVSKHEVDSFYERLVEPRLRGVRRSLVHSSICLYTNTSDDHFLIDRHAESDHILYASPCSGHGFKHSTAIGEAMVAAFSGAAGNGCDLTPFRRNPDRESIVR